MLNASTIGDIMLPLSSPLKRKGTDASLIIPKDSSANSPTARAKKTQRAMIALGDSKIFSTNTSRGVKIERLELPKLNFKSSARAPGISLSIASRKDGISPKKTSSPMKIFKDVSPFSLDIPSKKERQMSEMLENIVRSQIGPKFPNDSPFNINTGLPDNKGSFRHQRDDGVFKITDFQIQHISSTDKSLNLTSARNSNADNQMPDNKSPSRRQRAFLQDSPVKDKIVRCINLNRMQSIDSELASTEVRRQFTVRKGDKVITERQKRLQFETANSGGTKTNDIMQASTQDS